MFVTECFHNKCLNCQPCVQFIFSPRCESDMILSVMTILFMFLFFKFPFNHLFCNFFAKFLCLLCIHSICGGSPQRCAQGSFPFFKHSFLFFLSGQFPSFWPKWWGMTRILSPSCVYVFQIHHGYWIHYFILL